MEAAKYSASSKFATLSLSKSDRIRFLAFPEPICRQAEPVLRRAWPPGIKAEGLYAGSYEYQLKGRPWGMMGKSEAIGSRVLLRDILAFLYGRGWVLATAINLSEKIGSKDTLLFRDAAAGRGTDHPPALPAVDWLVVQFYHSKTIYLHGVGADGDAAEQQPMLKAFREMLASTGYLDKGGWSHDAYEFVLQGRPWRCHGEKSMKARELLLGIMGVLDGHGWEPYGTIRQRTDSDDWRHCDSWYLIRKTGKGCEGLIGDHTVGEGA
ncbi:hypothetical protein JX265_007528 [Neoarthrinium moseri]|uniref:Uncharacterized protein n=1 Tax=Neoarthrinium moseri TaxID=1658444 RepID=A0A9Q0APK0_9PEZI|nr:uncharacterized protein JN550_000058 [Neoarthrinium moseri]KAI1854602.1 hypothetical protein JX266_000720 [Neoarthrinium moseri]KAI1866952.1 hypothetical protein JX265_007528 [Neoarthrinium moseri]KAI1877876.1 hypothetical protein JN550_000058 [Neoarthrinium moseri]